MLSVFYKVNNSKISSEKPIPLDCIFQSCFKMAAKPVPLRQLGKNGPKVPALGFGLGSMSNSYGLPPSDEGRFQILDRAVELGNTFWDSAE